MNKTIIALAFLTIGCNKEEKATQPQTDCNCDRVVSHTTFNLPNNVQFGEYVTINDCSGLQVNGNWNTDWGDTEPINGNCY